MTAIVSAIAVTALLAAGAQQAFGAASLSLGTLTAFLLLLQRFFQPITALGEEWQTVRERWLERNESSTLALPPDDLSVPDARRTDREHSAGTSCSVTSSSDTHPGCRSCMISRCRLGRGTVALVGRTARGRRARSI